MKTVFRILQGAGLTPKLPNCFFSQASVDYLGHVVRPDKLEVAKRTTDAMPMAKTRKAHSELRSFLGLCNFYRRFVEEFSKIAAPLNEMLKMGTPSAFDCLREDQYKFFGTLKDKLLNPSIEALPNPGKPFLLDTDASDGQIGCAVLEEPESPKDSRPIGYWSRTLSSADWNNGTTEKEWLAIVWAVLTLRPYREEVRFTIRTNHYSLCWLLYMTDASSRLTQWRLRLSDFEYDVIYRPGVKHLVADALSQILTNGTDDTP